MQSSMNSDSPSSVQLPVMLVADVQDSLLVVVHDLSRLDGLLAHTMENLMERFTSASAKLADPSLPESGELDHVRSTLRAAVTELQFQDMASLTGLRRSPWERKTARRCLSSRRCQNAPIP
jgi:hypothetical protein